MKFKTQYNNEEFTRRREVNTKPSLTIPDQSMSVREIMARFVRGLPIDSAKVPIYHGEDDDMPDFRTLDLTEQQAYIEELEAIRNKYAKDVEDREAEKIKRRWKKELEKEFRNAELKKDGEANNPSLKNSGVEGTESPNSPK